MNTISFNPERYQIEISNMMDKLFNDSILSFNPYEKDDLFITNFIKENKNVFFDFDGLISVQNFLVPYLILKILKQTTTMVMIMK